MEYNVRILALDLGQDGFKVGFLVGGTFAGDRIYFACFKLLFDFVCQAFAVSSFVVDQRNFLALQFIGNIGRQRRSLLIVAADGAKYVFEPTFGQHRVGGGSGNYWNPGFVVNLRGSNRHTGIQVTYDRNHFGIHQFLGDGCTNFRIRLIVFCHELDVQQLAIDFDLLGIGLIDRESNTVFIILAQVRDGTRQWARVSDGHCHGWLSRCSRRDDYRCRFRFFLATANKSGGEHCGEYQFMGIFHRNISREGMVKVEG